MKNKYNVIFEEKNGKINKISIFEEFDNSAVERAKILAGLSEFKLISIIKEVEIPID